MQRSALDGQLTIVQLILQRDGVGLVCIEEHAIVLYDENCGKVHSMCINGNSLFFSTQHGIIRSDLSTQQHSLIIHAPKDPCIFAKFGSDVLYINQRSSVWRLQSTGEV